MDTLYTLMCVIFSGLISYSQFAVSDVWDHLYDLIHEEIFRYLNLQLLVPLQLW